MSFRKCQSTGVRLLLGIVVWTTLIALLHVDNREAHLRAESGDAGKKQSTDDAKNSRTEAKKRQREKQLRKMRTRAGETKVFMLDDNQRTTVKPVPEPIFRYSDQPRLILDATLWVWGKPGRPIALQKVELYRRPQGQQQWLYCMASLSEELIEAEWRDGKQWSAKKPGIKLQPLPNGPKPANSKTGRLFQLKKNAQRFSATINDTARRDGKQELRLLPRPIYRYSDPESGLQDGAIFSFATNGTNPAALLLIELHQRGSSALTWRYGLTGMTSVTLSVRLDQKEVWRAAGTPPLGSRSENPWTWFFLRDSMSQQTN